MTIQAVIFDMDGLLINSEPFWQASEKLVFGQLGIDLTTEMCMQTMGWKINEVIAHWYKHQPWEGISQEEVRLDIVAEVERLIRTEGQAMAGAMEVLEMMKAKGLRIGLASSSPMRLIQCVTEQLGIRHYFETIHSAENEAFGKPHPAVFLTAARSLQVDPEHCLVFEDSYNGLLAAKNAGMITVAVPEGHAFYESRFDMADLKLPSLLHFTEKEWQALNEVEVDRN